MQQSAFTEKKLLLLYYLSKTRL